MNMGHINFRHFFSADGLKEVFVSSYEDISARIEEGTVNRLEILNFKRTSEDQKWTSLEIFLILKWSLAKEWDILNPDRLINLEINNKRKGSII